MRKIKIVLFCLLITLIFVSYIWTEDVDQKLQFAKKLFKDGYYGLCITQLEKIISVSQTQKDLDEVYYLLAESYFQNKDYTKAQEKFERLQKNPAVKNYLDAAAMRQGDIQYINENYEEAIKIYDRFIEKYPNSKHLNDVYFWTAASYQKLYKQEEAIKYYNLVQGEKEEEAKLNAAFLYFTLGESDKSEKLCEQFILDYPKSEFVWKIRLILSKISIQKNRFEKALSILNSITANSENLEVINEAYLNISKIHYTKKRYEDAVKYLDLILKSENDKFKETAVFSKIDILYAQEKLDDTIYLINKAKNEYPSSEFIPYAYVIKSNIHLSRNEFKETADACEFALSAFPENEYKGELLLNLGKAYFKSNNAAEAEKSFLKLKELEGEYKELADYYLAETEKEKGNEKGYSEKLLELAGKSDNPEIIKASYQELAQYYYENEDYEKAENYAEDYLKKYPDSSNKLEFKYLLQNIYYDSEQYGKAVDIFKEVSKEYDKSELVYFYYNGAYSYFQEQKYWPAADIFLQMVTMRSADTAVKLDARERLGDCYYNLGKYDKAVEQYNFIIGNKSADTDMMQRAVQKSAMSYDKLTQYTEALKVYSENSNLFRDRKDFYYWNMGELSFKKDDYSGAVSYYDKIITDYPDSDYYFAARIGKANSNYNAKNYAKAQINYTQLLEDSNLSGEQQREVIQNIVWTFLAQDKPDLAVQWINDYLSKTDNSRLKKALSLQKANIYKDSEQFAKAKEDYLEYLRRYPDDKNNAEIFYWLGWMAAKEEKYAESAKYYNDGIKLYPKEDISEKSKLELAKITYYQLNQKDEGIKLLESQTFSEHSNSMEPIYLFNLGKMYTDLPAPEKGRDYFDLIIKKYPSNPLYYDALLEKGKLLFKNENYNEAIDLFLKIIESRKDETGAEAQFYLAESYEKLDNVQEALLQYMKIDFQYSAYEYWTAKAWLKAGIIYYNNNDLDKSKQLLKKIPEKFPELHKEAQEYLK